MRTGRELYRGSACAMVTPFTKENTVDCAALKEQAAFQLANGTAALVVCGTTGEASTMTPAEQREAISAVAEAAGGKAPVIAGVGGNDTKKAAAACQAAKEAGADACLAVTPYYNKTTQDGLVAHFTAVADASPLPLILYNVPSRTGLNLLPETAGRLAAHQNIVGLKESSGDMAQVAETALFCGEALPLYSGNDENTLTVLALGGLGVISVAANVAPALTARLCALFFAGDLAGARAVQLSLLPLIDALFMEVSPIPVKAAMSMTGKRVGEVRLPLVPAADRTKTALRARLKALGLLA